MEAFRGLSVEVLRNAFRWARRFYWRTRLGLGRTHPTFLMTGNARISRDLRAEEYAYVGPGCDICPGVTIGRYSMLGPRVQILGNDHNFTKAGVPIIFSGRPPFRQTMIGRDVWIGANAIIRAGVVIGDGAIVGAGAVVVADVAPFSVVGGIPSRELKRRFSDINDETRHSLMLSGRLVEPRYCRPLRKVAAESGVLRDT